MEHREALVAALAQPRFEIIPIGGADEQASRLPRGTTVTVTCSPARGVDHTLQQAERLARLGLLVVPHVSARLVAGRIHLERILRRLADLNLREVFVVGGDARQPAGPFAGAGELLRAMAELGHNLDAIGVAAYPEHHPLLDEAALRRALADKERFATYMVTQICFDAEVIGQWLARTRQQGIALPVYIGLPGVVDRTQLLRIAMKIGVGASARFLSKHAELTTKLLKPGSYGPTELVERLAPYFADPWYNIRGLHINTFNQVESSEQWRQEMLAAVAAGPAWRPERSAVHPDGAPSQM